MKTCTASILALFFAILLAPFFASAAAKTTSEDELLFRSYLRFSLAQEVRAQALTMAKKLPERDASQVKASATAFFDQEMLAVRTDLENTFGQMARDRFRTFINDYLAAEKSRDPQFLRQLADTTRISAPLPDYPTLRSQALKEWLEPQMTQSSRFLSEVQTWADVRGKQSDAPPLAVWLSRNDKMGAQRESARTTDDLAGAEAPLPEFVAPQGSAGSSMDTFTQLRREKRVQAMQDAQSGMQQMAMERQSAEQELGAQKMAKAQAEAENMRAHAQKLAAVENEAMAQRENSWGNRIKRIIGGTVSAGVGAFTGGIGAEAGQRAANEMFK